MYDSKKKDCYFYTEEFDHPAIIAWCAYHRQYGVCPCEKCDKYISKNHMDKLARYIADLPEQDGGDGTN